MTYQCTEDRFLRDVQGHEMTVIHDDGASRHIKFKKPGTSSYCFDLITWPGSMCISGDCGTYVFSRTNDMFQFFRMDERDFNHSKDRTLQINAGYWAEKVTAESRFGKGVESYSEEKFNACIKDYFDEHFRDELETEAAARAEAVDGDPLHANEVREFEEAATKRAALWDEIESDVLNCSGDESDARQAANDFDSEGFQFSDFWEHRLNDYTFHYIWCIYAIAWGIQQYDLAKEASTTTEESK